MECSSVESEYLLTLLRCAVKSKKPEAAPDNLDWKALLALSKSQQVYSIIAPVIDLCEVPQEFADELTVYTQNELLRMLAMNGELEELEKELEKRQIKYMPLKGCVIRDYYPLQKMRQMSDFDILYDESKRSELLSLMKERGYTVHSCSENSDDFTKKPFYTFEWHRDLFFKEHDFYFDFSYVWDNAVRDEQKPYLYHMSREDLYLHTVAHMYKHYTIGGLGIRFFADIYVLLQSFGSELDRDYIAEKLHAMELEDFEKMARELIFAVMEEKELTAAQTRLLDFIMENGIYGSGRDGIKVYYDEYASKHKDASVARFFMSKVFPSADFMKRTYPVLERHIYLLPYYYVVRLFDKLIHSRKRIADNVKILTQSQKEEKNKAK